MISCVVVGIGRADNGILWRWHLSEGRRKGEKRMNLP